MEKENSTETTKQASDIAQQAPSDDTQKPITQQAPDTPQQGPVPQQQAPDIQKAPEVPQQEPDGPKQQKKLQKKRKSKKKGSTTGIVKKSLLDDSTLFSTPIGEAYGAFYTGNRVEVWPLKSWEFEMIIARSFFKCTGELPTKKDILKIRSDLIMAAHILGSVHDVHIRNAAFGGFVYVDLCNERGELVKITPAGWTIVKQELKPPFFTKPAGMLPLPTPEEGGDIAELAEFVRVRKKEDFILLASLVLGAMNPNGPFPIFICLGPQGSGKSSLFRFLGEIIDPSEAALTPLPRSERDLLIASMRSLLLRFDNVSKLSQLMSDALCRLSTEGEMRTRKLYTNIQEIILKAKRPFIINGISTFAFQNDLLDRAISFLLANIPANQRRPETEIRADWEKAKPRIQGAFYTAVSAALANLDKVKPDSLPRMADFASWVIAAEPACPWEKGEFLKAYEQNRIEMIETAIEAEPVGIAILKLMEGHNTWTGTSTELLKALEQFATDQSRKLAEWPKAPVVLSNRLMRLEGFLVSKGLRIDRKRLPDKRLIVLAKIEKEVAVKIKKEAVAEVVADTQPDPNPEIADAELDLFDADKVLRSGTV